MMHKLVSLAIDVFMRGHNSKAKDHVIHIETPDTLIHYEKHPMYPGKIYFSRAEDLENWDRPL